MAASSTRKRSRSASPTSMRGSGLPARRATTLSTHPAAARASTRSAASTRSLRLQTGRRDRDVFGRPGDRRRGVEPHGADRRREVRVHRRHGRTTTTATGWSTTCSTTRRIMTCGTRTPMRTRTTTPAGTSAATQRVLLDRYLPVRLSGSRRGHQSARHFDQTGWKEGRGRRSASTARSTSPPIRTSRPRTSIRCAHFLAVGSQEGRQPFAPTN